MTDQAELQDRIAKLAGQINQKKQEQNYGTNAYYGAAPSPYRGTPRWSPYGRGRAGVRGGYVTPVKNLSLVNGASTPPFTAPMDVTNISEPTPKNFATNNTHQLMTKNVFDREKKQRDQRRATKRQRVDQSERAQLKQHTLDQGSTEVTVDRIRFQLRGDQSKLIRLADPTTSNQQTPKIVKYRGFNFLRTKHGNLVRANAVKSLTRYLSSQRQYGTSLDLHLDYSRTNLRKDKPQCEHFTKHGTLSPLQHRLAIRQCGNQPCTGRWAAFTANNRIGKCPYGRSCHFAHDPEKVAICPAFLKDKCTAGEYCDLSHVISSNRVSACYHFLRGNCTNDACRYPHVYVSPSAPVCRPFARLGYCANDDCEKRHVFECPDYDTAAGCTDPTCQLPHPDRAHVLRKAAAQQAKIDSEEASDVSSDEDDDQNQAGFEDIDSDEAEDVIMGDANDGGHELSQQADFISFS